MKKSSQVIIAAVAVIALIFVSFKSKESKVINVVIDAGHGGKDFGASAESLLEKEITAAFAAKIKSLNVNKNVVIHFTRSTDEFVELTDRADHINKIKPDVMISLHVAASKNKHDSGVGIFLYNESPVYEKSVKLANRLGEKLAVNNKLKINEVKNAPLMILKKSEVPALMVELGYLTNENDRAYLTNDVEQDRIAQTILELINEL